MIRTKQLKMVDGAPKWVYGWESRDFKQGDRIHFLCNGRGRGGHFNVTAVVDKVNPKTLKATEQPRSYSPGTKWVLPKAYDERYGETYVELPSEVTA